MATIIHYLEIAIFGILVKGLHSTGIVYRDCLYLAVLRSGVGHSERREGAVIGVYQSNLVLKPVLPSQQKPYHGRQKNDHCIPSYKNKFAQLLLCALLNCIPFTSCYQQGPFIKKKN